MDLESVDMSLTDALVIWCNDPLASADTPSPSEQELAQAYTVLRRFLEGRCTSFGAQDPGTVDDVVQHVLDRLSRRAGPPDHGAAYLSRAARNGLTTSYRKQTKFLYDPDLLDILVDPVPLVGAQLDAAQQAELLERIWEQALATITEGANARRKGLGERVSASLTLLHRNLAGDVSSTATESQLRTARRHRQLADDILFRDLERGYHGSEGAKSLAQACPTRVAAIQASQERLLTWLAEAHADPHLQFFVERWLAYTMLHARLRKRVAQFK
jgi:hypothetical protein